MHRTALTFAARVTAALLLAAAILGVGVPARASGAASQPDVTQFVNPLIGTSGNGYDGGIDDFPGADAPFGMIQWSPDTPSQPAGGGYNYNDSAITGFSMTHLSGPGCSVFGDIGTLPTIGAVVDPATSNQLFSHASETASPGYYAIRVGMPSILSELTVTQRTGLGRFTFPQTPAANILVNASSNQAGVSNADVRVVGDREITGSATSGWFCGMPGSYTVYFKMRFDRPFIAHGTWLKKKVMPQTDEASGVGAGAWATFDASANPSIRVQTSLSWVSLDGAEANLRAEATTWDFDRVKRSTARQWAAELGRARVDGGTTAEKSVFYTALYHAMLHPNVFSDADGRYRGFDGQVHDVQRGHAEYATFSGWDIYRTEIPLLALLEPKRTSDMMRSLVHAAQQSGWLPKWSLVNVETAVMGGDPSDPMLASGYAFGARDFDARAALAAMIKGASQTSGSPGQGWYYQRPGLDEYLSRGYVVNVHTTNVAPVANGASLTLEYSLDDFSIAQLAKQLGDQSLYRTMLQRGQNWSNLMNQSTGFIAPRDPDGAFQQTPITENGQSGFQEGTAAQYTWMVPQNLAGLIEGLGGRPNAIAELDAFFTQIDAGQDKPYAWLGNEPSIGSPWAYLAAGAPWKAQAVIRQAMTQLWGDTPDGIPGNDDLGTMSAWYVWCALGLYPQNPAVPTLDLGAPLFPHASIRVPGGAQIDIDAPRASADAPYVQSIRFNGAPWSRSWVPFTTDRPMRLAFDLSSSPNPTWASAPADAPPSYANGPLHFPASSMATLQAPTPAEIVVAPGGSARVRFGVANGGTLPAAVSWHGESPDTFTLNPSSGRIDAPAGAAHEIDVQVSVGSRATEGIYDVSILGQTDNGAQLARTTAVVRVARPGEQLPLAYVANFFSNSITPVDPRTYAAGAPVLVGENPRDLALSPDGKRVYVTNESGNSVSVVDTATQAVIATVNVGHAPFGIRVTPDGSTAWVANNGDDTVQPIDTATLVAGAPIPVGHQPESLAIAPDGSTLYVVDPGSDDVTPVDLHKRGALPPITVGARPRGVAVSPDAQTVYVANFGANTVTPIDAASKQPKAEIPVGVAPRNLAFSPDGKWLYVVNFGPGTVTPIDLSGTSPQTQPQISVGLNPVGIAFDPNGATAFVVNADDNDCVPIDVASRKVGAPIRVGDRPLAVTR